MGPEICNFFKFLMLSHHWEPLISSSFSPNAGLLLTSPFLEHLRDWAACCVLKSPVCCRQKPPYLLGPVLLLDSARPLVQVCLLGTCGLIRTVLHIATGTHSYYYIPAEIFLFQAEHS